MRLAELSDAALAARLADGRGIVLDFGIATARVRDRTGRLAALLKLMYGHYPADADAPFCDLNVALVQRRGMRRWIGPQIDFFVDGQLPFEPFPADTTLPLLEWGMNWCVADRAHHLLPLHAGALEKDGVGILLPAASGSGKSTLTAALMLRGYRLLSDEFGALRPEDRMMIPSVRPIALKNESVEVIRGFAREAVIGPVFAKTRKGDVAHAAPTAASVEGRRVPVAPRLVVFPRFERGASLSIDTVPSARAFLHLAENAFNYELLGPLGFETVAAMLRTLECRALRYGDLDDAVKALDALVEQARVIEGARA